MKKKLLFLHLPQCDGLDFCCVDSTLYSCATHTNGMHVYVLGIPKGKYSKQMKTTILSYRIIRIKRLFSEFIDV